jgi:hypothetical protein
VAAVEQIVIEAAAAASKGEALRRDSVGRVQDGGEHDPLDVSVLEDFPVLEDAEQWRLPVVGAELAVELGVGDEAPPAPADCGGARER